MTNAKLQDTLVLQENIWSEGWKDFFHHQGNLTNYQKGVTNFPLVSAGL